ncbi:hypothetical protein BsWGS_04408 [Bradybaena similaris]
MCSRRSWSSTVFISQLLLIAPLLVAGSSSHEGHKAASSVLQSSSSGSASRQKRAPGWGKRAPGWGKRNVLLHGDFLDQSESALKDINSISALRTETPLAEETDFLSDKRAPGWGKRAPGWGKRAPGWGKRSCFGAACFNNLPSLGSSSLSPWGKKVDSSEFNNGDFDTEDAGLIFTKRAPGWGKRNYHLDMSNHGDESDNFRSWDINKDSHHSQQRNDEAMTKLIKTVAALSRNSLMSEGDISADKRAPGWGKRSNELEFNYDDLNTDKRAPGWGKRAPGWGKRSYDDGIDVNREAVERRAPGWGKRAPGWGKRAPGWGKRAPGWGKRNNEREEEGDSVDAKKRAPGWGKRAPGWGKRNFDFEEEDDSDDIDKRAPGWGKRAPGWGKRDFGLETDGINEDVDKRAPGWGKRAPGWGKRSFRVPSGDESFVLETRSPGWGGNGKRDFGESKRAPGWGRKRDFGESNRATGWDQRSVRDNCQELQRLQRGYIDKVSDADLEKCGNARDANMAARK